MFVNATKKGVTLLASSGDQGAAQPSCDGSSWIQSSSSPASDPLVTGVGGTELHSANYCLASLGCNPAANPVFGTWLSEIGWNEGDPYGDFGNVFGDGTIASGGGYSTVWSEPPYQEPVVPRHPKGRAVPDVAYNGAILHGVLVRFRGSWFRFGGTSCGAPQWAGLVAIADQSAGHDYGFINDALYKLGKHGSSYAAAFHDITSGNNNSLQFDSGNNPVDIAGFKAGTGWDAVTGLGSPQAGGLLTQLAGTGTQARATLRSTTRRTAKETAFVDRRAASGRPFLLPYAMAETSKGLRNPPSLPQWFGLRAGADELAVAALIDRVVGGVGMGGYRRWVEPERADRR